MDSFFKERSSLSVSQNYTSQWTCSQMKFSFSALSNGDRVVALVVVFSHLRRWNPEADEVLRPAWPAPDHQRGGWGVRIRRWVSGWAGRVEVCHLAALVPCNLTTSFTIYIDHYGSELLGSLTSRRTSWSVGETLSGMPPLLSIIIIDS